MSWLTDTLKKAENAVSGKGARDADKAAQAKLDALQQIYDNAPIPDQIVPEYQNVGSYQPSYTSAGQDASFGDLGDPRLADYTSLGQSAMSGVSADPRLQDTQYGALSALDEIVKGGGLSAQDKADLAKIQGDVAQADRGRREAILQNLGARGMAGGGQELLAQLQSSQAATDRASQSGLDIAGMAQQRALDAIMQSGNLAGSMRNQSFNEQAAKAQAQDIIDKFNAQNAASTSLANANIANQQKLAQAQGNIGAAQFNAQQNQARNLANTQASNQALQANAINAQNIANLRAQAPAQATQQQFENQQAVRQGQAGALGAAVDYKSTEADRKAKEAGNYRDAIAKGLTALATPSPT